MRVDSVRTLLGTLLMARSGLSTRTVRMADRLALCPSREYSITLETENHSETDISVGQEATTGAMIADR